MLINIYLGTRGWKWTGDDLQASEDFLISNFFFRNNYISIIYLSNGKININLGTMGWKKAGNRMISYDDRIFFLGKSNFLNI